jgi:uncharacterized protein YndB with AHSA1/START domain
MGRPAKPAAGKSRNELALTMKRSFDAPAKAVYRAWIDPAQIARWIGPRSVKAEVKTMQARVGGAYKIVMHHGGGKVSTVQGVYHELVPGERLVFTWAWLGDDGKPGHESQVTLEFRAAGKKTEMTILHENLSTKDARDRHEHGWIGSFDKLEEVLTAKPSRRR